MIVKTYSKNNKNKKRDSKNRVNNNHNDFGNDNHDYRDTRKRHNDYSYYNNVITKRKLLLSRYWQLDDNGVYMIAYSSLKGDVVELIGDNIADDNSGTRKSTVNGNIILNGVITIAPYNIKSNSKNLPLPTTLPKLTNKDDHQEHSKDQSLCLITCICQSDYIDSNIVDTSNGRSNNGINDGSGSYSSTDGNGGGNGDASSNCGYNGSGDISCSSGDDDNACGGWRIGEQDSVMNGFIFDHLTSLRDRIFCDKYDMEINATIKDCIDDGSGGVDGYGGNYNSNGDDSSSPPIVVWSNRYRQETVHPLNRLVVII